MEIKPGYKLTEIGVIPEDWVVLSLNDACIKIQDGTHFSPRIGGSQYKYITSKNIGRGTLNLNNVDLISEEEHKKIYKRCDVKERDILLTKDGINTGNTAINTLTEEFSLLSSVALLRVNAKQHDNQFLMYQILSNQGQSRIANMISGNAITRLTLDKIKKLNFAFPSSRHEQELISEKIHSIDSLITSLEKLIEKKKLIKQGVMQELLTGKRRLPGFSGEWETKRLGDSLVFERPDKYIYWGKELKPQGTIPVLTANKSFILGYANEYVGVFNDVPAIIFDDFTTDCKYVRFAFKVKSSAIKILKPANREIDLRFIYYTMQSIKFSIGDHKRYYISEYQHLRIKVPKMDEQEAIAEVIEDIEIEIDMLGNKLQKQVLLKQAMMQELLTGRIGLI